MNERCQKTGEVVDSIKDLYTLFLDTIEKNGTGSDVEDLHNLIDSLSDKFRLAKNAIRIIIKDKLDLKELKEFSEGLAAARKDKKGWFYIDIKGKVVLEGPFDEAEPFKNDEAIVCLRNDCWHISRDGKQNGHSFVRFSNWKRA